MLETFPPHYLFNVYPFTSSQGLWLFRNYRQKFKFSMSFLISEGRLLNTTLRMWSAKEEGATTKYYMTGSLTLPAQQFFDLIFSCKLSHPLVQSNGYFIVVIIFQNIKYYEMKMHIFQGCTFEQSGFKSYLVRQEANRDDSLICDVLLVAEKQTQTKAKTCRSRMNVPLLRLLATFAIFGLCHGAVPMVNIILHLFI